MSYDEFTNFTKTLEDVVFPKCQVIENEILTGTVNVIISCPPLLKWHVSFHIGYPFCAFHATETIEKLSKLLIGHAPPNILGKQKFRQQPL